jgi:gamma-glutamyltranspeptidase/glutathione hydrolase
MVAAIVSISFITFSPARAASIAPVTAENGMVVSAQHLATQVGVDVLKRGGNAVDAPWRLVMPWPWSTRRPAISAAADS